VANPIYREIILRVLSSTAFASLPPQPAVPWPRADGREYAIGTGRMDVCLLRP
jgi:hypothetical protein